MRRITEEVLLAEGFTAQSGDDTTWNWSKGKETLISVSYWDNGSYSVYFFDEYKHMWPRKLCYWEELAPLVAAVSVGY